MAFLGSQELARLGLASLGDNVMISERASIYGAERIDIGSNVRIDDFCILSAGQGRIRIGSYVHLAAYSSLIGAEQIAIEDFANISSRVGIYSSNDDYSGLTMTSPVVPDNYKDVDVRPVRIGRHAILGSGCIVLPGVDIGDGAAVGALSLVRENCRAFHTYAGVPATERGPRERALLELEGEFLLQEQSSRAN